MDAGLGRFKDVPGLFRTFSRRRHSTMTVDEFIQAKIQPELREIAQRLRALMREHAPEAKEVISYGIPAWRLNHIIAVISPTKKDITFAFSRGAEFEDKYGMLKGVGKVSKHVKIKDVNSINDVALQYYIRQAVVLDS